MQSMNSSENGGDNEMSKQCLIYVHKRAIERMR